MAENFADRMKELADVYFAMTASNSDGTFGRFLRSKLTRDALRKCSITAVDLRYVTLQPDTQLYSFGDHWQPDIAAHVYSTRFDDPVPLVKTAEQETSCARLFVTTRPVRVLSVQRSSMLELGKMWMRAHYETGQGSSNSAANGEDKSSAVDDTDLPPAMPRNMFQRKDGMSLLDFALHHEHHERASGFDSIGGIAFDEATASVPTSRHLLLFGTGALCLQQELIYPAKKKLRKAFDGFMSCVSEPSRPQAPPMKRGKSVNTPPILSHSPAPAHPPPPPVHTPPPPHPSYQPKPPPQPTPRPGTPNATTDEKSDVRPPAKPQAPPRETAPSKESTLGKVPASPSDHTNVEAGNVDETSSQM